MKGNKVTVIPQRQKGRRCTIALEITGKKANRFLKSPIDSKVTRRIVFKTFTVKELPD